MVQVIKTMPAVLLVVMLETAAAMTVLAELALVIPLGPAVEQADTLAMEAAVQDLRDLTKTDLEAAARAVLEVGIMGQMVQRHQVVV